MTNRETISDEALIGQLEQGDAVALTSLYKRHSRFLYALALRITRDPQLAEEVLQDTFFQLWRRSSHFNSARGSLVGWLLTITRNGAIDRLRQCKYRFQYVPLCDETLVLTSNSEPSYLDQYIARELVAAALAELPQAQRETIALAYFEGWTCEEIAFRTRTPVGTVKTRLRSALQTMKRNISNPVSPVPSMRVQLPVMLENVLITEQLLSRPCRQRRSEQEFECLDTLAQHVTASPEQLIDFFLKMPITLCRAGTAGLSLLEMTSGGEQVFRWTNLAGKLAKHVGGATPRNFSPCGVTLDCDSPQLFAYPGRYFHYFNDVEVPIVEGLVIPFRVGENTEGTVWIVSHEEGLEFDSEDVRIMTGLAEVLGCALHLMKSEQVQVKEQTKSVYANGDGRRTTPETAPRPGKG